ncbi:MAG: YvcK family protein [Chloroflexi bacterium]|nr:YvcK family protein [Chloroflexota bacterium]
MSPFRSFANNATPNSVKWLYPGMQVKRWILLLMIGIAIISLGVGYFLREAYDKVPYLFPEALYYGTLQFLPRWVRGVMFLSIGAIAVVVGFTRTIHSLFSASVPAGQEKGLVDMVYDRRFRNRGPKVVAIGGGTGLSTLLRGMKEHTGNLTAVVTVADDGGSSGRLRRDFGVLPPGDIRQCIAALADAEPLMSRLLQYRFPEGSGLEGHSFGNLFIVAMSGVVGNFEDAIKESCRVLAVRGQILPSTLENVTLSAVTEDNVRLQGESQIPTTGKRIREVFLEPTDVEAYPEAVRALNDADVIILGPGSLFTSVMPNLLVPGVAEAIRKSRALKVYICNVATQVGETDGFNIGDHVRTIFQHVGPDVFHHVIANGVPIRHIPPGAPITAVDEMGDLPLGVRVIKGDVVNDSNPLRHDPKKLSKVIMKLYYERNVREGPAPQGSAPLGPGPQGPTPQEPAPVGPGPKGPAPKGSALAGAAVVSPNGTHKGSSGDQLGVH